MITTYVAACAQLTPAERDVLRDILCARIAADYLADLGELSDRKERKAA